MPRSEARLQFDIWEGLVGLSADARLIYCVVLTDRSVSHAGQGFIRLDRWEQAAALPVERIEKAMGELEQQSDEPHVAFDRTTGEFLIRTMIRRDGYADQPYLLKGSLAAAKNIESKYLKRVLARELRKLPAQKPDGVSKSGKAVVYPDPHACADEIDPVGGGPEGPPGGTRKEGVYTLYEGCAEGVDCPAEDPAEAAENPAFGKGFETQGGGGGGVGGGNLTSVTTSVDVQNVARTRAREGRRRTTPAELNASASKPAGRTVVENWLTTYVDHRPLPEVLRPLYGDVDALLARNWSAELITECLVEWQSKGIAVRWFPEVASQYANSRTVQPIKAARPSAASGTISWLQAQKTPEPDHGEPPAHMWALPGGSAS